jgi:hypothetical protein
VCQPITVPITVRRTIPDLGRIAELMVDRATMREIGLMARERIIRRTAQGKDERGQPFQAYSQGYRERKGRELGVGNVNLQVSGAMLNALTIVDVTDHSVTLGFS